MRLSMSLQLTHWNAKYFVFKYTTMDKNGIHYYNHLTNLTLAAGPLLAEGSAQRQSWTTASQEST